MCDVIQGDRDAAANIWRDFVARPGECIAEKSIRSGGMDDGLLVQTLAAHRIANQAELLPDEPSEAVIRAVDKACHEHWPNARKMAVGMYGTIRTAVLSTSKIAKEA